MKIPFVIDNRDHKLVDVLNDLLTHFQHRSMDIATAYFTIRGFELVKNGLTNLIALGFCLAQNPRPESILV